MSTIPALKQRSITAIIFGIVVIGLLLSGRYGAAILAAIILIVGSYEYARMVLPDRKNAIISDVILSAIAAVLIVLFVKPYTSIYSIAVILSCSVMILGIINLYFNFIAHAQAHTLVSILYLALPLGLMISWVLHHENYSGMFWLGILIAIWMCDTFAYIVGSQLGKRKLFERISPKKSWEGFVGAGLLAIPIAYALGQGLFSGNASSYDVDIAIFGNDGVFWMLIAFLAWAVGTYGDLVESSIKRLFGVKDSGNILPGHGGALDRFDSFIYILPFVLFLLQFFTK